MAVPQIEQFRLGLVNAAIAGKIANILCPETLSFDRIGINDLAF